MEVPAVRNDNFPKDRFKLALIDPLLDGPFLFDLEKPVISIELLGEDFIEPLAEMGMEDYVQLFLTAAGVSKDLRLFELTYVPAEVKWMLTCSGSDHVSVRPGVIFKVPMPGNFGSFSFMLLDNWMPISASPKWKSVKLETSLSDVLVDIPLSIIASNLTPFDCISNLCIADPYVAQKIKGQAEWEELTFFEQSEEGLCTLLDFMRVLHLASPSAVRKFSLLMPPDARDAYECWRCLTLGWPYTPFWLSRKIARFIAKASKDVRVRVVSELLVLIVPSVSDGKLQQVCVIDQPAPRRNVDREDFWDQLTEHLKPSLTTQVRLEFHHQRNPWVESFSASVPAYSRLKKDGRPLSNVTEVWWHCPELKRCVIPFQWLPNLRELSLVFEDTNQRVLRTIEEANLTGLRVLSLTTCVRIANLALPLFHRAAPNIEQLSLISMPACFRCCWRSMRNRLPTARCIKLFKHVQAVTLSRLPSPSIVTKSKAPDEVDVDKLVQLCSRLKQIAKLTLSGIVLPSASACEALQQKLEKELGASSKTIGIRTMTGKHHEEPIQEAGQHQENQLNHPLGNIIHGHGLADPAAYDKSRDEFCVYRIVVRDL